MIDVAKAVRPVHALAVLSAGLLSQTTATAQDGRDLYQVHCATCHGANLGGTTRGSALTAEDYVHSATRADVAHITAVGLPGLGMPGFGATLSAAEIDALVAFLPAPGEPDDDADSSAPAESARVFDPAPGVVDSLDYTLRADVFVEGLETPWAIAFIDADTALVTERPGRLRLVRGGVLMDEPVRDTPTVFVSPHEWNQGGLLDVAVDPDYAANGWIYLAYSHALADEDRGAQTPAMTRVVRGRLRDNAWVDQETVFEAEASAYTAVAWHYGGRMALDENGHIFIAVGDRGAQDQSRDPAWPNGKIHRVRIDGGVPADNPFASRGGMAASVFSVGNRNPQGLAIKPGDGALWQTEHGPRGGDELNVIENGADYGWPAASYGIDYDGSILTPNTHVEGTSQPVSYWRPSIAVSGLTFYEGDEFPLWRGKLLVTGLASRDLRVLTLDGERVQHEEIVFRTQGRPYEPVLGPDGAIYVVTDAPGQVLRLTAQAERRL